MSNVLEAFKMKLSERLKGEIPAELAHKKIMKNRSAVKDIAEKASQARKAGVLLLLYPKQNQLHTVFILRQEYEGVHSKQVSLPGGAMEEEDQSLEQTALREAHEELAILPHNVEVIGRLSPLYVPPSNFLIQPFVGIQTFESEFIADPVEVKAIIECPVHSIMGDDKVVEKQILVRNQNQMLVKGFQLGENLMWGATAMIVKEFEEILADLKVPSVLNQSKQGK